MSDKWMENLHEVIAAHEATNAKLLLRVAELEMSQAVAATSLKTELEYVASLREQVATLTQERDFAHDKERCDSEHISGLTHDVNILTEQRDTAEKARDATKADAARLREVLQEASEVIRYDADYDAQVSCLRKMETAISATDSAAWLESKIAERTAARDAATLKDRECIVYYGEQVASLTAQLVAATNDAARAEWRARDVVSQAIELARRGGIIHYNGDPRFVFDKTPTQVAAALAAPPDSDERLREVMFRVVEATDEVWRSKTTKTALEIVNEVLRGGA